jgi:adenosylmethionine-8-amino-7-oxononanoate aminotransferase
MDADRLRQCDNEFVWHPFAPMQSYREEQPPIITRGEGFELIDVDGRQYIDGFSSLWCNIHGHHVPAIDQAVREQLDRVAHSTLLGHAQERSIELAERLVALTPAGLNKVFYSDSGATAVEVALKIAFQYHRQKPGGQNEQRNLFVSLGEAYHGDTIGSVSVGAIELFHRVYGPLLFRTLHVPSPVAYRVPVDQTAATYLEWCYDELDRVLRTNADHIAAVIMEPLVQGAAGILVHPPGYLARVRKLTRELGLLLIADEVAVGFGRTGTLFACEHERVEPDLLCLGKGISGGYLPLAATLATDAIFDAFLGHPTDGRTFYHGHTYTGNALACAAGLASLRLFETNRVLANVDHIARVMAHELASLADHPHVGDIRQCGVMVGIELVQDRALKQPFPDRERVGHAVTVHARRLGIMTRPLGDVVVLMPAPAMPDDLVRRLVQGVTHSIDEVTAGRR